MKNLLIAAAFTMGVTAATAGSIAYIPPEATAIEEPAMMGGSGGWIIPLVIVAVLALALTNDDCRPTNGQLSQIADPCRR